MQKFIIIGGGARGIFFTEILENELNCKVVAIMDNFVEGNPFIEARLKEANIKEVEIYNDLDLMLSKYPSSAVDGAFIMTPEWTHLTVFKRLTEDQYNIFLEKPIATTKEDVKEIGRIAKHYPKVIQVGFVMRYSPFYRKIKSWIKENEMGRITQIQMNERLTVAHGTKFKRSWHRMQAYTGGFINEKCSHDLDMMCFIKEKDAQPIGVMSYGSRTFVRESVNQMKCSTCPEKKCIYREDITGYAKYHEGKVLLDKTAGGIDECIYGNLSDINDAQTVMILFDDNTHGIFNAIAMSGKDGRDVMIHFEYGMIFGDLEEGNLTRIDYRKGQTEKYHISGMNFHGGGDTTVVREFTECIRNNTKPVASVEDGLRASLLAFAADESIKEKRLVEYIAE
jgi:predicted dehydrogenase